MGVVWRPLFLDNNDALGGVMSTIEATADDKSSLFKALSAAQAELKNPAKDREANAGKFSYKYADLATVTSTVRPVLAKHGLSIFQPTVIDGSNMFVETVIAHESGQSVSSLYPVCSITGDHQKMGGALTYARRYGMCSMLAIAAEDDNDGQGAATVEEGLATKPTLPNATKKSSAQAKREGGWEAFTSSIDAADTVEDVDGAWQTAWSAVQDWPNKWREQATEYARNRKSEITRLKLAEEQLGDSVAVSNNGTPVYGNVLAAG